ncbi:GD12954 [Drosophila simulans]|uniref:GD12954 n=1 Tax=Drosophila simulans TaxID=7240 RepID=B4QMM5_DROSI|nr:GD12954 [Drosophila simulans]
MDSLKLPKANSATSSASGSNSNLSGSTSASASAATSPTSSGTAVGGILSGAPKSPPGLGSSTPISVRFNANEESLDDILQSFHQSKHSPSGGASGGGDASPTSNLLGMKNNGLGLVVGNCDSLSSSPSQPQMQGGSASLFGNDEVSLRNNFMQAGGFFNRKSWRLADADYVLDATMSLDPRKTVFVGGVPRPLKAFELAMIMDRLYGGVCYAGIDTDPELKYPKGAGRVAFSNQQSYIAAISARFVQLQHGDIDKRVEVKPYVLDDQMCDECEGQRCGGKFAPFFCANVTCLQYYCEHCWAVIHSRPGREYHKPLVKEGADRPRAVPFRWC